MTIDEQTVERYLSLKKECLGNPVFQQLLDDVEQDILAGVKQSPEMATAAHYELLALERLRGKLKTVEVSYEEVMRREQESPTY